MIIMLLMTWGVTSILLPVTKILSWGCKTKIRLGVRCHARSHEINDISVFLFGIGIDSYQRLLSGLIFKFHQGYLTIGKCSTERAFGSQWYWRYNELSAIPGLTTRRSLRYFFPWSRNWISDSVPERWSLWLPLFLAKTAETIHLVVLGHGNGDIAVFNIRLLQDLEVRPIS